MKTLYRIDGDAFDYAEWDAYQPRTLGETLAELYAKGVLKERKWYHFI